MAGRVASAAPKELAAALGRALNRSPAVSGTKSARHRYKADLQSDINPMAAIGRVSCSRRLNKLTIEGCDRTAAAGGFKTKRQGRQRQFYPRDVGGPEKSLAQLPSPDFLLLLRGL